VSSSLILPAEVFARAARPNCFPLATLKKIAVTRIAIALFARLLP
jgi:hypothetical protein